MNSQRNRRRRGSSLVEFTFVGIPMIFILISMFEIARGMWVYNTMADAVKAGARFSAVRGDGFRTACVTAGACNLTVGDIVAQIESAGAGLVPSDVRVLEMPGVAACTSAPAQCPTLKSYEGSIVQPGLITGQQITIRAAYGFASALSFFWPGAGPGMTFNGGAPFYLPASSRETVQF